MNSCPLSPLLTDLSPTVRKEQRTVLRTVLCSFFVSVRIGRIELPIRPWQGRVLPLNHIRYAGHYSIRALPFSRPGSSFCAPGGDRTPDPLFRRQMLYPLSYGRAPEQYHSVAIRLLRHESVLLWANESSSSRRSIPNNRSAQGCRVPGVPGRRVRARHVARADTKGLGRNHRR